MTPEEERAQKIRKLDARANDGASSAAEKDKARRAAQRLRDEMPKPQFKRRRRNPLRARRRKICGFTFTQSPQPMPTTLTVSMPLVAPPPPAPVVFYYQAVDLTPLARLGFGLLAAYGAFKLTQAAVETILDDRPSRRRR